MSAARVSKQVRDAIVELAKLRATDYNAAELISMSLGNQLALMRTAGAGPEVVAAINNVTFPFTTTKE